MDIGNLLVTTFSFCRKVNKMENYCIKCKVKQPIVDTEDVILKNGRNAIKGKCSVCGTKITRIVKKAA